MESDPNFAKPLICSHCGSSFALDTCLAAHKTIEHHDDPPHKCSVCKIAFFSSIAYNDHIVRHSLQRETPTSYFKCSECKLDFPTEHGMRVHLSTHTGLSLHSRGNASWKKNNLLACAYCPAILTGRKRYHQHMKTHKEERQTVMSPSIEKSWDCEQCPLTFQDETELQVHKKQHLDIEGLTAEVLQ